MSMMASLFVMHGNDLKEAGFGHSRTESAQKLEFNSFLFVTDQGLQRLFVAHTLRTKLTNSR